MQYIYILWLWNGGLFVEHIAQIIIIVDRNTIHDRKREGLWTTVECRRLNVARRINGTCRSLSEMRTLVEPTDSALHRSTNAAALFLLVESVYLRHV